MAINRTTTSPPATAKKDYGPVKNCKGHRSRERHRHFWTQWHPCTHSSCGVQHETSRLGLTTHTHTLPWRAEMKWPHPSLRNFFCGVATTVKHLLLQTALTKLIGLKIIIIIIQ